MTTLNTSAAQAPFSAVLFDLDGTLIDTAADFIRIIKQMCTKYGHACPSDIAIREQVSAGARAMVKLLFGDELANADDENQVLLQYRQEFLDAYEANICVDSRLFAGFDELLTTLETKGVPWGIVTNKPRYLAEQLLDKLALSNRCAVLVCPDDVVNTKPDPEPLFLACRTLGIVPTTAVYIGDHIRDIQAGNGAGMTTVVAEFGYLSQADKASLHEWQADVLIPTPQTLSEYILANV
ncbi:MAG: HAD-IA family hydrolase [Moraxella sp.]|nr:HAD-IA family hydrolase [Moraxella sp.]